MRPFPFLAVRPEDGPADDEYAAMLRFTGLDEAHLHRVRLEQAPLGEVDLDDWSGIVLGGGPFQSSDPPEAKSAVQRRVDLATEVGNHAFQRGTLIEQFGVGQRGGKGRCGTAHKCLHGNRG